MKNWIFFVGSLLIAIAAVFGVKYGLSTFETPGYVLIGIDNWSMEASLTVFVISLIVGFYVFYLFFRWLGWLLRLPGHLKSRSRNIKFNRSQDALVAGLVGSAEGKWEQAEKVLIKHAANSGAPMVHYLTAAKAAQSRGAFDKRDEYIKKAIVQSPGSEVAIGMTHAELHFSAGQYDQALEILTKLQASDATHTSVLSLLRQTYQHLGDWQGLRKLLPVLNKNKVLPEPEIKSLEKQVFGGLLNAAVKQGNNDSLRLLWTEIPNHIKKNPDVATVYFAGMIDAGLDAEIENELVETLTIHWDPTLLLLFGSLKSTDVPRQLAIAENLLPHHKDDGMLLTILGELSLKCRQFESAEQYLLKSNAVDENVQSYRLLGDMYSMQGEEHKANLAYKQGLELASRGVVTQLDMMVLGTELPLSEDS